jgi:5-methylcytosine-specific restriction endonuclease McrA
MKQGEEIRTHRIISEKKCPVCGFDMFVSTHHIRSFAKHPELRYEFDNGQTLCVECHKKTDNYGAKE